MNGKDVRAARDALSGWDRGQDTLDLARPYDFSARAHEVLRFRGSADGSLYLRGRSLGDYTGTGWGRAQEPEGSQALNYAAYAAASASYGYGSVLACDFAIETARPYDTLFLPYFTLSSAPGGTFVPAGGETAYAGRNLVLTDGGFGPLPDSLRVTARTGDGEVMAVQHRDYPVYGVQFHPESIMTPDGKTMLRNFFSLSA